MKTAHVFKLLSLILLVVVASCSSNSSNLVPQGAGISIEASDNFVYDNTTVNFTVRNGAGSDVTSNAAIAVDGVVITGNSFLFSGLGTSNISATLGAETTEVITVDVIEPSFTTKMLIEDYTGAWCAWCPVVTKGIIDAHAVPVQGDKVIAVAVHNGDIMEFSLESQMRAEFGVVEFPTATLNRTSTFWRRDNVALTMDIPQALNFLTSTKPVGIAINSSVSGSNVIANVKVGFDLNQQDLKLVVFLLENGFIGEQLDNTPFFGGPGFVPDFEHNEILRRSFTDVFGDAIPADQQLGGTEYAVSLSVTAPGVNTSNWDIVAFVVDAAGEVVNVQKATVGTNQDFD